MCFAEFNNGSLSMVQNFLLLSIEAGVVVSLPSLTHSICSGTVDEVISLSLYSVISIILSMTKSTWPTLLFWLKWNWKIFFIPLSFNNGSGRVWVSVYPNSITILSQSKFVIASAVGVKKVAHICAVSSAIKALKLYLHFEICTIRILYFCKWLNVASV